MTKKHVDAIVVGAGWAGAIMAKELTEAGLSVIMLERGSERTTPVEGAYPESIDELRGQFANASSRTSPRRQSRSAIPLIKLHCPIVS